MDSWSVSYFSNATSLRLWRHEFDIIESRNVVDDVTNRRAVGTIGRTPKSLSPGLCLEKSWATYQWREDESYNSRGPDHVTNHYGRTEHRESWQVPIFRKLPIRKWRCGSRHTSKVGKNFICIPTSTAHLEVQYNNKWCQTTSVLVHCSPNRDLCQRNMENNQQNQQDDWCFPSSMP